MKNIEFFRQFIFEAQEKRAATLKQHVPAALYRAMTKYNVKSPDEVVIPGQVRGQHKKFLEAEFLGQAPAIKIRKRYNPGIGCGVILEGGLYLWLYFGEYNKWETAKGLAAPYRYEFV